MENKKRLIDANALCKYFAERFMFLKNASETRLSNGMVRIDKEIQTGAIIAKEFLDKANNAPTVDAVEVVHGKWISSATTWGEKAICSVCGRDLYVNEPGNGLLNIEDLHYCPNCGAKMDGGNEDV